MNIVGLGLAVNRGGGCYIMALYSNDDRKLSIASLSEDGYDIVHPDEQAIIREIQAHGIDVLIVDPFAESHELGENSNSAMNKAAAAWRRIARATGCAILLLHHVRKGPATDIDAARGAKALTDSARVGLLMSTMTELEAEEFDIAPEDRLAYVRVDDAKSNMARRAGVASWYELHTVELGNATPAYPNGDRVAAIAPWQPPSLMGQLTTLQCNEALDAIERGPGGGVRYCESAAGKGNKRWVGQVLIDLFSTNKRRAKKIIDKWLEEGLLTIALYDDPQQRKLIPGVHVVAAKRPGTEVT